MRSNNLRLNASLLLALAAATFATSQTLTSLRLIDADSNLPIPAYDPIADEAEIDLSSLPSKNLSIEALVDDQTGSVRFSLNANSNFQTESNPPYALAGDSNGNFNPWNYSLGEYTLTATPYSQAGAAGAQGNAITRSFTIIDSNEVPDSPEPGDFVSAVLNTSSPGIHGELKLWHRVTLAFEGPLTSENASPNPFTDYRLDVTFTHPASNKTYTVPGYYAADGHAGESGSDAGTIWRVHFTPDEVGIWNYTTSFRAGQDVATNDNPSPGSPATLNGNSGGEIDGTLSIANTDKSSPDNRARGRLQYVGGHYLRYAHTGEYFLKQGPDAPENLLAYEDFDGSFKSDGQSDQRIKSYSSHLADWQDGDSSWQNGKGRELIGAINYLASEGLNVFSFITMNINGDDRNVFPYLDYNERERMDVSRLDQWEVIFDHADRLGFYLHFKTQETENELLLNGGALGPERKLYYRELIARFGHHLALNWNLGEENNNQSDAERIAMAEYFKNNDPYQHNIVIHTYPGDKDDIYSPLLGNASELTGVSLQGGNALFNDVHNDVLTWRENSASANKPWVIAYDEPGNATDGLVPDSDDDGASAGNHTDARARALWGVLLGGGTGTEWYFGYGHNHSDLTLEDFRSRDQFWDYCRRALDFIRTYLPFHEMSPADNLIGNANETYCFALEDQVYALYLPEGEAAGATLDLSQASGEFDIRWLNPRTEDPLEIGTIARVTASSSAIDLGSPPDETGSDWVALLQKSKRIAYIHGDVSESGTVPSGNAAPYDQMLLTDAGNTGLSQFRELVEGEGYSIEQLYDQTITLDTNLLADFDVVIFGLHQKIWTSQEKDVLDQWIRSGGGVLIYSDSASGGKFNVVGAQNTVGQSVTNNLISRYGMEVTVDQANGVRAYRAGPGASHVIVANRPVIEGEGVSPVAVDPNGPAIRLIPYETNPDYTVSGDANIPHQQNITIPNPEFAALALAKVDSGNVIAMFDRQPMWNNGPGSDIEKRDNQEILGRIIRYLAGDLAESADTEVPLPDELRLLDALKSEDGADLRLSWRAPANSSLGETYFLDRSANLSNWTRLGDADWKTIESTADGSDFNKLTVELDTEEGPSFFRLSK